MARLRRTKRRVALLTALADIAGLWPLERTTEVLTRFADLATQQALELVLREAAQRGEIEAADQERLQDEAGVHRARHGQARRVRAQLLERHRSDRPVRSGPAALSRAREPDGVRGAPDADPGPCARAPHARGLRVPHRSAPAAASAGPPARAVGRGRRAVLRAARPELGARRADQGARRRGRPTLPATASCGALEPFLWRSHLDYAAIRDIHSIKRQINALSRPWPDPDRRPRSQGRARRHPRDRVLRPDPAVDPRRPPAGVARARHLRGAARAGRSALAGGRRPPTS